MFSETYRQLRIMQTTPEALEKTVAYLAEHLGCFLRSNERVLICYPNSGPKSIGCILERAVERCGCVPVRWGPDHRWKTLLRQAFSMHMETILGPPQIVLGLMKLARYTCTPLYIRNAMLAGYSYSSWLVEGIKRGLDCRIWGCYCVSPAPVIAGFACSHGVGIHLRGELFDATVVDSDGEPVPDPQRGRLMLTYKKGTAEELVYDTQETAKLLHQSCSCGSDTPRIVETAYVGQEDVARKLLEERLLAWSSILDYRAEKTEPGTALELVVFPGESLPQIPSCAKLIIRPWDPEQDSPFCMEELMLRPEKDV